jgi:hypothetical protein
MIKKNKEKKERKIKKSRCHHKRKNTGSDCNKSYSANNFIMKMDASYI